MESVIVCNNILLSLSTKYLSPRTLRNFCTYYFYCAIFIQTQSFAPFTLMLLYLWLKRCWMLLLLNVAIMQITNSQYKKKRIRCQIEVTLSMIVYFLFLPFYTIKYAFLYSLESWKHKKNENKANDHEWPKDIYSSFQRKQIVEHLYCICSIYIHGITCT